MERLKNVAEWLTERALSPEQLVALCGLDAKVVAAIIGGRYTPSPQQRQRVAETLGLHPRQIAWGHTVSVEHMHGHGPQFGRSP